ncbi:MAG: dihydrofolate reductase [Muribaculaceae bacterium]|nr:dihydrofolate reductase [Muribaculaceae bacterium]
MTHPDLSIIVAVDRDGGIGRAGDLLYHISADLRRFKQLTMGHPVIMGRRTFESLPKGALPGRRNIVISRNAAYTAPGIEVAGSLDEALAMTAGTGEAFVIGGASIYAESMSVAARIYLTEVDAAAEADTYFPPIGPEWHHTDESATETDPRSGISYRFVTLSRE